MKLFDKWLLTIALISLPLVILLHLNAENLTWRETGLMELHQGSAKALFIQAVYSCYPWIVIYFFIKYHQKLFDWYKRKTEKSFLEEDLEIQNKFLNNQYCTHCKSYKNLTFQRELEISAMKFIIGICGVCKQEVRVRTY